MGPADDIIDVLYRYQYETSNNVENEELDQWEAEQYNNPHVQELVKQQQRGGQNYRNHNNNNRQAIRHQQQGQQYYKQQRYQTNELYYNTREILEEEPIYVPRSIKADIIFKNDDDFFRRRRDPNETLVELASGAFQKKVTMPSVEHNGNGLRKRLIRQQGNECTGDNVKPNEDPDKSKIAHDRATVSRHLLNVGNTCLGLVIMAVMAYKFSGFLAQLHENDMWFSEITEVEREISFRTEQGLYYSYFKQLIKADSFLVGVSQLASDNKTESTNTINIMQRFNIHQEIVLSVLYRIIQPDMAPILFYVSGVFSLQVVLYSALFVISWSLTGTWFSGVLALVYASMNRKVSFF